ncbi:hypothetical protein KPL43_19250 [Clostridium estertheticum]|nr:hypothetical protein [Clostridium estertheticum]MBU3165661.1 hypothetical protein [Clostridium estertheticum]
MTGITEGNGNQTSYMLVD